MKSDFKWKHFEGEIILLAVRWYLRYALTYRDLVELALVQTNSPASANDL